MGAGTDVEDHAGDAGDWSETRKATALERTPIGVRARDLVRPTRPAFEAA
ncbi:hypothetical protein GCM10023088_17760 [Actinomadura verrucosospora]